MPFNNEYFEKYFEGTDFGQKDYANMVHEGLMKVACGYHNGLTMENILIKLGYIKVERNSADKLTVEGKMYLYRVYKAMKK